jgi:hypothetical protein
MKLTLKNVRMRYGDLFEPRAYEDGEPKYSVTLLIPKGSEQDNAIQAVIEESGKDAFGKDWKTVHASIKGNNMKYCYRDGDLSGKEEMAGHMVLVAKNVKRPKVYIPNEEEPLVEDDGTFYRGCRIHAIVDIYAFSKRKGVFATLEGVKFYKEDEAFVGSSAPVKASDFDDLSLEEDDLEFA